MQHGATKNCSVQEAANDPNTLLCFCVMAGGLIVSLFFCVLVVSLSLKGPQRPQDGSRINQWRRQRGPHLGLLMHLLHPTNGTSPFPLQWWTTTRLRQQRRRKDSVPPLPHTRRRRQRQRPTLGGASPRPTRPVPSTCTAQVRPIVWRDTCRLQAHNPLASRLLRWVCDLQVIEQSVHWMAMCWASGSPCTAKSKMHSFTLAGRPGLWPIHPSPVSTRDSPR